MLRPAEQHVTAARVKHTRYDAERGDAAANAELLGHLQPAPRRDRAAGETHGGRRGDGVEHYPRNRGSLADALAAASDRAVVPSGARRQHVLPAPFVAVRVTVAAEAAAVEIRQAVLPILGLGERPRSARH